MTALSLRRGANAKTFMAAVAVALLSVGPALSQEAASPPPAAEPIGILGDPCAALAPAPDKVIAHIAEVARAKAAHLPAPVSSAADQALYDDWQNRLRLQDFAGHCHYDAKNAALPPATAHRVVFFGDSITELWGVYAPSLFTNDVVNRGIGGQTTSQMVGRFQSDVIDLHPQVVHILAGINDIAGNTGPTTLAWIEGNVRTMVELAKAHHIRVVLAAVLPAARFAWRPSIEPISKVQALNFWMASLAKTEHVTFVDYGAVLDDGRHGFKTALTTDGVHPNADGYAAMRPLAERAISRARRTPAG